MAAQMMSPKQKKIADSNRTMFMWVAGMSAVVGICAVVSIFLVQQIMFKANVVGEMRKTYGILRQNNKVAGELTSNVVVKETSEALNSAKADDEEKALQVILDALPADRNPLALGASLQYKLLDGINGLTIESLTVDGDAVATTTTDSDTESTDASTTIPIKLQVSATSADAIKEMLTRFERSIRVIDIDTFTLEKGEDTYEATIQAHAYYQPPVQVQLKDKTIPSGGKTSEKK